MSKIGKVITSSPSSILIGIDSLETLERHKRELQIGNYVRVSDGNTNFVVAVIQNIRAVDYSIETDLNLVIDSYPVGRLVDNKFYRGNQGLPVPTELAHVIGSETLDLMFKADEKYNFPLGRLLQNDEIDLSIDGDSFFGRHVGVLGSTGSGKSCAVARILQSAVGISDAKNLHASTQRNSHIVIFDFHSEYESAFKLPALERFNLNVLSVDELRLPYWLMNSEELESLFIESREFNSHNQVSIFKQAVILNKERYNPSLTQVTYDTPVYFSIREVLNYIENMNREVIGRLQNEDCPKLLDGTLVHDRADKYFEKVLEFAAQSTARETKASNGAFFGEFNRLVSRLEAKLSDKRLRFLLEPKREDGTPIETEDFKDIVKQFIGYLNRSNVTIVDVSGVPFEVLSITVSLVSRLIFDFSFHYSKIRHDVGGLNDAPIMIVYEEAHNYLPRSDNADFKSSRRSIERIAKEGRKYGLSVMVVSQRPSEVSETVLAQCNNFVVLRLTNPNDQNYVRSLMPDSTRQVTEMLPSLSTGQCIAVGDAVLIPSVVQLEKPNPEPQSKNVDVFKEWAANWIDITFDQVIARWTKEDIAGAEK